MSQRSAFVECSKAVRKNTGQLKEIRIAFVELTIEKLVFGGDGMARLFGADPDRKKTVFVPFVLGGEKVEAEITEEKPGFSRARLEKVLEPASDRVLPGCPYFQQCGGCHYQHVEYAKQAEIKGEIFRETLKRIAKLELPDELRIHPSPPWNYRNRTRLKVQTAPKFAVGYYKLRSHELLPIQSCPISSPLINVAIKGLWSIGRSGAFPSEVREIEFFANDTDEALLVEAYCAPHTSRQIARQIADRLIEVVPGTKGAVIFEQRRPQQETDAPQLGATGETFLTYQASGFKYRVDAGAFFQVNRFLIDELVRAVTGGLSGKVALDLYAGVGLFSVILAQSFAQVIAVEASQTSMAGLRHNAPREVKAVKSTTEQYLKQADKVRPDLVVVDPPRSGLSENVIGSLVAMTPPRIRYVSCDPSTLARDLRSFVAMGYRINQIHLFDLFPQTFHIESVVELVR